MKTIILASNNAGKIKEYKEIFPKEYEIITMSEAGFLDDIEETGKTFYENALIKAKTISAKTNADVIADDSGLMVEALDGAPGVFSARYAGLHGDNEANKKLLLKNLQGVTNRRAKFHACIVLYKASGEIISAEGETFGEILHQQQGSQGFGYDPLFFSYDLKKSFGVASKEEKNSVSHRSRALKKLLEKI